MKYKNYNGCNIYQDYMFHFDKKPEDFLDKNINQYVTDMIDKYYGNCNKEEEYSAAISRIEKHKKIDPITNATYIELYPEKNSDIKITQLDLYEEKSEKLARYNNGEIDVYDSDEERISDEEYINTNNYAYNHKLAMQRSLLTLGKEGEKAKYLPVRNTGSILKSAVNFVINGELAIRNSVAFVCRSIGKSISAIYGQYAKQKYGIYSNKPAHRFEARKDYFIKAENDRLAAEGKKPRPFRTLMKARFNAIFKYKEGNEAVLKNGYKNLKASYVEKALDDYYSRKYQALNSHIAWLESEKIKIYNDISNSDRLSKLYKIEEAEKDAIAQRNEIMNNSEIKTKVIKGKRTAIVQTDAISLDQHERANKANVTRVISGTKVLGLVGTSYFGINLNDLVLKHSKIENVPATVDIVPSDEGKRMLIDEVAQPKIVSDYSVSINDDTTNVALLSFIDKVDTVGDCKDYFDNIMDMLDSEEENDTTKIIKGTRSREVGVCLEI